MNFHDELMVLYPTPQGMTTAERGKKNQGCRSKRHP